MLWCMVPIYFALSAISESGKERESECGSSGRDSFVSVDTLGHMALLWMGNNIIKKFHRLWNCIDSIKQIRLHRKFFL